MIPANNITEDTEVVCRPECRCHPIVVKCPLCSLDMVLDWVNAQHYYPCCHYKLWWKNLDGTVTVKFGP